jgi:hypothetical protein
MAFSPDTLWGSPGRDRHASYNVAKKVLSFVYQIAIPRAQLCAAYGDGFHGAPLDCNVHQAEETGMRDPGAHHDQTRSQATDDVGGAHHV